MCIGLAKHWLKKLNGQSGSDAHQTISLLKEKDAISTDELLQWRKIIGLRNGLVQDYLNIFLVPKLRLGMPNRQALLDSL